MFNFREKNADILLPLLVICLGSLAVLITVRTGNFDIITGLLIALIIPIFSLIRSQQKYLRQARLLKNLVETISDLVFSIDKEGKIRYISPNVENKSLYKINEVLGKTFTDFIHPEDHDEVCASFRRAWQGEYIPVEFRVMGKNGRYKYMRTAIRPLSIKEQPNELHGLLLDITDRKLTELHLEKIATFDHLTGVYNRGIGLAILEEKLRSADRENRLLTICFVDIDDLKKLNDTFGHLQGDSCIKSVVNAVKASIREVDTICRLGGDEFLIIFPDCSQSDAEQIVKRIQSTLHKSQSALENCPEVTISYGLAEYNPLRALSPEDLIAHADAQMYDRKKAAP